MTVEELKVSCLAWDEAHEDMDVMTRDSILLARMFDEVPIKATPEDRFFHDGKVLGIPEELMKRRMRAVHEERFSYVDANILEGNSRRAYTGFYDFGHTAPEYEDILSLGLTGLLARLEEYAKKAQGDRAQRFYEAGIRTWRGILRYVGRCAQVSEGEQKAALEALCVRPPQTLYEAIQLILVYYAVQHRFEQTIVRTLGRLDSLLFPFFKEDMASGKLDEAGVIDMLDGFLRVIDSWCISANIPFAIGGCKADGGCAVNAMTYLILQAYTNLRPAYVKLHFLYTDHMPKDIVAMAMDSVRKGSNSICFMGDQTITDSLIRLGEDAADARSYAVVGCYECGGKGEITCSCNARVNLPKALEAALNDGRDPETGAQIGLPWEKAPQSFDELFAEFLRQTEYFCRAAMLLTDACERLYDKVHSSPIMSATYEACVVEGKDIYCEGGGKYNNSSLNALGLATAVDSLDAIRRLVYEEKSLSLDEIKNILRENWQGYESLRLRVMNQFPKYGMARGRAEEMAVKTVEGLASYVNGKPNVKGGIWRLGTFSVNWRWEFGVPTGASADGRLKGEPLSQNTGASFGADRLGATAHVLAVTLQDHTLTPNGSVLDIDFHASAVHGEDGLAAMVAVLATYIKRGGFAVHFNVLDVETLRRAMARPEDYPNLQVRLCGWNVQFSNLSHKEKEEFILRAEKQ